MCMNVKNVLCVIYLCASDLCVHCFAWKYHFVLNQDGKLVSQIEYFVFRLSLVWKERQN